MPDKYISFIIPHYGREPLLLETLQSIANQDYDPRLIEVLVVTQNKSLSAAVQKFNDQFNLSIHTQPLSCTISELRNYGSKKSKGNYLAFLDADVSISNNWIKCMLEELEKPGEGRLLVGAIQVNSERPSGVEMIRTAVDNMNKDSCVDSLPGHNLFLNAKTFQLVDGFPAGLTTCEDVYFTNKISKLGTVFYSSGATHIHLGEDKDLKGMFRKEIWRGQSNLESLKGRIIPLRELPSIIIPGSLPFFLITCIAFLINGFLILAFASIILMLLPPTVYSVRLQRHVINRHINFYEILVFHLVYFSARTIGLYLGVFKFSTKRMSKPNKVDFP